jgi:hypothetical protein
MMNKLPLIEMRKRLAVNLLVYHRDVHEIMKFK